MRWSQSALKSLCEWAEAQRKRLTNSLGISDFLRFTKLQDAETAGVVATMKKTSYMNRHEVTYIPHIYTRSYKSKEPGLKPGPPLSNEVIDLKG